MAENGVSTHNTNNYGRFFELNEIRSAKDEDFEYFIHLANDYGEGSGWTKKLDKNNVRIWQKETGASPVKMALIVGEFHGVSASTVFDVIMDGEYRKTWDENVIDDYEICRLDDCNDIGYYSMKCPGPLKNRDFVNQRSWKTYGEEQFVMFNHSVSIEDVPLSRKFIRGVSYITGFLIRNSENGCTLNYVTQTDPKGKIPSWIINLTINKLAPSVFRKLFIASCKYEEWKSENKPDYKPWRYPEQNKLKIMDPISLRGEKTASCEGVDQADGGQEAEEEVIPEQEMKELVDRITEKLDEEAQSEFLTNGHGH